MKRLALLGSPVGEALSPALHRAAYEAMGLPWTYHAIECRPEDLAPFLTDIDSSWGGFSLTMPLKRSVVPLLDEVSDDVAATGTANTIVLDDHRRLVGANTDLHGMLQALAEAHVTQATTVTVLGAGATATTALAAARHLGCHTATVVARDVTKTGLLQQASDLIGIHTAIRGWAIAGPALEADLVISAVPPHAADSLVRWWPGPSTALLDVTYRPWPSSLARTAEKVGSKVIDGLTMLIHQAAKQVELQTGRIPAPLCAMRQAADAGRRTRAPCGAA